MTGFYYLVCPLCQQDVQDSKPDSYYMLYSDDSAFPRFFCLLVGNSESSMCFDYPEKEWKQRSFLFHRKCYELAKNLTYPQIYLLIDVVEPTFLRKSLPPMTEHGAFSQPATFPPLPWNRKLIRQLPNDILDMVLEFDIGRLLFVMSAASQITLQHRSLEIVPEQRFIQRILIMKANTIRIHLVIIGSRTYISHLSDPSQRHTIYRFISALSILILILHWSIHAHVQSYAPELFQLWFVIAFTCVIFPSIELTALPNGNTGMPGAIYQDYELGKSKYLAVKTDGIGVVDIAFSQTDNEPEWILRNYSRPFKTEISIIRSAFVSKLRMIQDVILSFSHAKTY